VTLRGAERAGFCALDDLARDAGSSGLLFVHGPAAALGALSAHIERRARGRGRSVLRIGGLPCDDAWRELAVRLGAGESSDPLAAAEAIASRADDTVILVHETSSTHWGRAVVEELARLVGAPDRSADEGELPRAPGASGRALILVLLDASPSASLLALGVRFASLDPVLSPEGARRFWEAVAEESARLSCSRLDRLDTLEGWWSSARATPLDRRAPAIELGEEAARLLARIALSRRGWPVELVGRLGPPVAQDELVARGVFEIDARGRLVSKGAAAPSGEPEKTDLIAVAEALDTMPRADAWAAMRASELFALAGDAVRSEAAAVRAITGVVDAAARADFWRRWDRAEAKLPADTATSRLLRSTDLALRTGDVDRAQGFANALIARAGETFETMLALGRSTTARGDLTTAAFVLNKAIALAPTPAARARVTVELAEVRYMDGSLDDAKRFADEALAEAGDRTTRLLARNVIGKHLLARARYTEAEQHFAADACDAACGGDFIGELRARLNRAIALMYSNRRDEARAMLLAVLEEGQERGELSAIAFALANLAILAIQKHEYAAALTYSERSLEVVRRIGDRFRLAVTITNLAEIRLQMGLVTEAEQTLAFGRKACGTGMHPARAAHFALVMARIHLARGNSLDAAAEVAIALASARGSLNGDKLGECHRLAARIALEDGDVGRAGNALKSAREEAVAPFAHAEVALLEGLVARASGAPFSAEIQRIIKLAREADAVEILREANVLGYHAAMADGDAHLAKALLHEAIRIRARLADALPEDLRKRFLARRDLAELARLERNLADDDAARASRSGDRCDRCGQPLCAGACVRRPLRDAQNAPVVPALRRMAGRDPAMVSLVSAIQKVGQSDATVLIQGESGTGKELVAEAIHEASPRRAGPLVKVNCSALVETLLLSELFGHEKGSFTGAAARRRGRFELAEGGTLFLDEIGDISHRTQVALLRVLQDKTYERVGGVTPLRANVRIVCATHRDLRAMVARGEFREDLYYRLRGFVLEVPALRQRTGDLMLIASALLDRIAAERGTEPKRVSPKALEVLSGYAWPGNIRELENALRAAALFADGDVLEAGDFTANVDGLRALAPLADSEPAASSQRYSSSAVVDLDFETGADDTLETTAELPRAPQVPGNDQSSELSPTDVAYAHVRSGVSLSDLKRTIERDCIERALVESRGNITRAATLLGMKRPRLSQLVKQYGFGGVSED
jgi:transcriptional regulator with GAF, ATPase, and Fis domain/tetratricopeptide (TPR) repeat protein